MKQIIFIVAIALTLTITANAQLIIDKVEKATTEWKKVSTKVFQEVELQPKVLRTVNKDDLTSEVATLEAILALTDAQIKYFQGYAQLGHTKTPKQRLQERYDKLTKDLNAINKLK